MYRRQIQIHINSDVFFYWLSNELNNISRKFTPLLISKDKGIGYYLEIKTNLIPKDGNKEFFIIGDIYKSEIKISEIPLIKIMMFPINNEQFILEISSEVEYQDIRLKAGKDHSKRWLSLAFAGVTTDNLSKIILPFLDWITKRIYDSFPSVEKVSNKKESQDIENDRKKERIDAKERTAYALYLLLSPQEKVRNRTTAARKAHTSPETMKKYQNDEYVIELIAMFNKNPQKVVEMKMRLANK